MKIRHPAATLRVPGAQVGGMRRVAPTGSAPMPHATPAPTEGGAEPQAPTHHLARRYVTKVKQAPARKRQPRASRRRSRATPTPPPASASATAIGQTVATLLDELSFAANQPGSYQRMGGF